MNNEKSFKNLLSSMTAARIVGVAILAGALALAIPQQLPAQSASGCDRNEYLSQPRASDCDWNSQHQRELHSERPAKRCWNVGIAGNSATNPLQIHDVDNAPRTAYAQTKTLAFNQPDRQILGNFDVPAGKRLVIESFSVFGKLPSGNKLVEADINAFQGGEQFGTQYFAPVFTGNTEETFEPGVFIVNSGKMHLEAVAGTGTVTVHLERDHILAVGPTLVFFNVSITGYLVDAPQ